MRRVLWIAALAMTAAAPRAIADAPPGHYEISKDEVRDTRTGLVWQRVASPVVESLEVARARCRAPFRLPEIKELATLVDESATALPAIDPTAFPGALAVPLWSATLSNTKYDDFRCFVHNPDGTSQLVYYNGSLFGGAAVRCVRP